MKGPLLTYLLSFDTLMAFVFTGLAVTFLPTWVGGELCKELLSIGINVLALIFSMFFAALAFIISSSDNEFVSFLEEENLFTDLVATFKWTLLSLFLGLIYSLVLYVIASFRYSSVKTFCLHESAMWVYCFIFFYSLIAAMMSTGDAIRYAQRRIQYVLITKGKKDEADV